jgi:glycosyltransferase involved in cell wall biosynthesis
VIFQRVPIILSSLNALNLAKRKNRRVFYDVDDLMFKPWRRAEMGVIRSGQVKYDDAIYAESLRKRLNMLTLCDGVICSTPFLQRELNSLGMPAILSRNAVDDSNFINGARRLVRPADEGFRLMFMSGTPTHDADFAYIQDVMRDILVANPHVTLTILGELRNHSLDGLPNVVRSPAVPRSRMFEMVAEQDLVLVPLERTAFNTAKSSLKFMECGAAGVPVIASDLFEFERDIRRSGAGMLANTPDQWRMAIQRFIDNPDLSREHGLRAFRYCLDHYSVGSRKNYLWNEICRFDDYLSQQEAVTGRVNQKFSQK